MIRVKPSSPHTKVARALRVRAFGECAGYHAFGTRSDVTRKREVYRGAGRSRSLKVQKAMP
jgi:hypothetical protein